MLAPHRDQENLVHSHRIPTKSQPKTPGPRFPKTPLGRLTRNDENAPTAFGGKNALVGTTKKTVHGEITTRPARPALATPMGTQSRAPLGIKTTNAKARPNQSSAIKGRFKQTETSQVKLSGTQRPKQRQAEGSAPKVAIQTNSKQAIAEEEPEYAPPAPVALPYQSDVLPEGGLTFRNLKKENILAGYYDHFFNPVDDNGVSRLDKAFDDEMRLALDKAVEQNDREIESLDWSVADVPETAALFSKNGANENIVPRRERSPEQPSTSETRKLQTVNSRRATSALSVHSDRIVSSVSSRTSTVTRHPLGTTQARASKSSISDRPFPNPTNGEVASRTTIGYSKGRAASFMMHPPHPATKNSTAVAARQDSNDNGDLTIVPRRGRPNAQCQSPVKNGERPQFTRIFDDDEDDGSPVTLSGPLLDSEDEDDFKLSLDI